jgi:hypothetical protein
MGSDGRNVIHLVKGSDGRPVKMAELPPPELKRWMPRAKAQVVAAVHNGLISLDDACERYALSVEEFLNWEETIDHYGLTGLRVNAIQRHRQAH